jgi:hypothetical protein
MDLERFPLRGMPLSMYRRQILLVKDWESMTMQDKSQGKDTVSLYWFDPSRGVTTLHLVSMYYVVV